MFVPILEVANEFLLNKYSMTMCLKFLIKYNNVSLN